MVAKVARDEAEKHANRMDALLAQDVVPEVQRDQAHLQLAQAESQLAMADATLGEVETAGSQLWPGVPIPQRSPPAVHHLCVLGISPIHPDGTRRAIRCARELPGSP